MKKQAAALWLVISLLAPFLVTGAWARPTTPEQARRVVLNWLTLDPQPLGARLSPQVKEVQTFANATGAAAYFVVYLNPSGLVLVPADDLVEPIIGFLPHGLFDPSLANPLGALVSNDIPGRVLYAREAEARALATGVPLAPENPLSAARRKWDWLTAGAALGTEAGLPDISDVRVAPFVQSKWDQGAVGGQACYNYYTPPYAEGSANNYPCGCGATALAQLMRYWQFPIEGVGTGSYTIYINGNPTTRNLRGGDGNGGPYLWALMELDPLNPVSPPLTVAQRQAIGALTYDAGVAIHTNYAAGGSFSYFVDIVDALLNTFFYSNARKGCNPSTWNNIPDADRNNMVNPNLHAKIPVILLIAGPSGGHFPVTDGYGYDAATMYHHLNLGWHGLDDAWYNLPNVETTWYTYNSVTGCAYNVFVYGSGEIIAGRVTDAGGSPLSGASVTGYRQGGGGTYDTTTDAKGLYALAGVPSGTDFLVTVSKTGYTFLWQDVTTGTSTDNTFTTGNLWGVDFSAVPKKNINGVYELLLLD
jgi:hypothetical protein